MASIKLTILSNKLRGTSFTLSEAQYVIGRSDAADITIADGTISGRHCLLTRTENGGYVLHDEGSTNGTRVNGEKVEDKTVPLEDGFLLQLGSVELLYQNADNRDIIPEKTISVISLDDDGDTTSAIDKLTSLNTMGSSIKRSDSLRGNKKHNLIFYSILGLLGIVVIVMLVYFVITLHK